MPDGPRGIATRSTLVERRCSLCGKGGIVDDRDYRRVIGWERPRSGGGLHSLALRQTLGEWAHRECVDLTRSGISVDQESMF